VGKGKNKQRVQQIKNVLKKREEKNKKLGGNVLEGVRM
jgi:hypothetical protein